MRKSSSHSGAITICFLVIALILYIQFLGSVDDRENIDLPEGLHPMVAERTNQLLQLARERGIKTVITDDFRSFADQNQLYEKGRTKEGMIVTHAQGGESFHNFGLAIDFAIEAKNGEIIWDMSYDGNGNIEADWLEVVEIAKSLGFEWGGDWKNFKDYPHLQMNFGLSIRELQNGKRPPEPTLNASQS